MTGKVKKNGRGHVAPTPVVVSATNPEAENRATEETVMTPLHRRVSKYAILCVACDIHQE